MQIHLAQLNEAYGKKIQMLVDTEDRYKQKGDADLPTGAFKKNIFDSKTTPIQFILTASLNRACNEKMEVLVVGESKYNNKKTR